MGLNDTPAASRPHIGFFGRRNAGKSSLVNAVTGQNLAIVSDVAGTTTDPVYKAMELLPLGPVMIIDTPGMDDAGALGELRVRKARQVLAKTDVAALVVDAVQGKTPVDEELIALFREREINFIVVYNKGDLSGGGAEAVSGENSIEVSAKTGANIYELKERIAALALNTAPEPRLVGDLLSPSDLAVLVIPIDKAAPKGRLILPQQQTIRDILEADAVAVMVKEFELRETLANLKQKPALVITDSQVFARVAEDTPQDIPLTSFSILFARYKGSLVQTVRGVRALEELEQGDRILIAEGCTHHRQCDDIGTVKLPRWIRDHLGRECDFDFVSGTEFPEDLSGYKLVVHCGGCMLNEREMKHRHRCAEDQGVPMTNYGILIAHIQGILPRSLALFPALLAELEAIGRVS
jgi:[FeFe] hydrogenase H-cluster maturation GTPase HydF